ncbi:M13 family metallopeptidase [Mesorhizobium sp. CAU 1741]|uniref:M13 family metallopeptidase n=1 Tax=Mesorhizobium sp. CAU 1741 TaxID=3140366 RepID=UPI00325B6860
MDRSISKFLGLLTVSLALCTTGSAQDVESVGSIGPDQLRFSVENMDRTADPRADFYRYAAGGWLDRVDRPSNLPSVDFLAYVTEHVKAQMKVVVAKAAEEAAVAPKGSPLQQVGDLFSSYMDVDRINALGIEPIKPEFARIDAISSLDDLSDYLGYYARNMGAFAFASFVVHPDNQDSQQFILYFISGDPILSFGGLYELPDGSPQVAAYLTYLEDSLALVGYDAEKAASVARLTLAIDREIHAGQLTPQESADPGNSNFAMSFAELQAMIPELNLERLAVASGVQAPERLIVSEPRYTKALSEMLRTRPLSDFKEFLKVKVLARMAGVMTTAFDEPYLALNAALTGVSVLPPREEVAQGVLQLQLGHPFSKAYVDNFFDQSSRATATDMIGRVKAAFRSRMEKVTWLTEETHAAALDKLDRLAFYVAYPENWIDYSSVDIKPDDLVGNIMALQAFNYDRGMSKLGKPFVRDQFADNKSTLPIIVNAAYNPELNGFEVPAAFLQPPVFNPDSDVALNFCRLGAVLGHEMTHGFDTRGGRYDADGNLRAWWTEADLAAFTAEAQKLISQADAFEILPGLSINGTLTVAENMADVGGLNAAYDALMQYLEEHPEEDVEIDGMTPAQRCFVGWSQLWASKANDQYLRLAARDYHSPNVYRTVAPLKHVDAFYEAFGIKEGDPMWLAPEQRLKTW